MVSVSPALQCIIIRFSQNRAALVDRKEALAKNAHHTAVQVAELLGNSGDAINGVVLRSTARTADMMSKKASFHFKAGKAAARFTPWQGHQRQGELPTIVAAMFSVIYVKAGCTICICWSCYSQDRIMNTNSIGPTSTIIFYSA